MAGFSRIARPVSTELGGRLRPNCPADLLRIAHPGQPPGTGESHVRRLVDMAAGIISEVRGLSYALMPPELEQLGLGLRP